MAQAHRTRSTRRGGAARPPLAGRRPVLIAAVGALVLAAVVAVLSSTTRPAAELAVSYERDTQVLNFRGTTFAGRTLDTAVLRGTPIVLNFYASWCTVCDRELPDFQRVSQRLAGRVHVLGANPQSNDTTEAQAAMVVRGGVTYPTLADPRDELLRQFNTTGGLPTTVFIDANGVVRKVHNGLLTEQLLLDEIANSVGVRV